MCVCVCVCVCKLRSIITDLVIVNKKQRTCQIVDFTVPSDYRVKLKEGKKRDKYLDLARELKTLWNMKVKVMPILIGVLDTVTEGTERIRNKNTSRDHPDYSLIQIGQNTEKSPRDLRRLAVTQTLVEDP